MIKSDNCLKLGLGLYPYNMNPSILKNIFLFSFSLFLFLASLFLRDPLLLKIRPFGLIVINLFGVVWVVSAAVTHRQKGILKNFANFLVLFAMAISLGKEFSFQYKKNFILSYDKKELATYTKHIIVGFRTEKELRELLTLPTFGFFVTHHNVKSLSYEETRNFIDKIQDNRKKFNFSKAMIATDQEGGKVSRLSPPLNHQISLGEILTANTDLTDFDLKQKVNEYADSQARELGDIGVNINFSPILDLKYERGKSQFDFYSRIYNRAIASDPKKVTLVAEAYSKILLENKIIPTLKHFPGIGRLQEDTHFFNANLLTSLDELENSDLIPFLQIAHNIEYPLIMLSHSTVIALDDSSPISFSEKGIQDFIRPKFPVATILITDDMNMGPTFYAQGGIGESSIKAINAGVDLLLISYDGEQIYEVLYSLIKAGEEGNLKIDRMKESEKRLHRLINFSFSQK